jgi:5-methyltetrahydropteroyltriglutamate--homocysteine methyltransferase
MTHASAQAYRADVVGSMLRPHELTHAREAFRVDELDAATYLEVEDRAVDEALQIQERAGVDVVSDGEMRREFFFDLFLSGATGVNRGTGWLAMFRDADSDEAYPVQIPFLITEKLKATSSPAVSEYEYASARTDRPVKVAIPSPTLVSALWTREGSSDAYPDPFECMADATVIVRKWIEELAALGCPYIQVDAPEFLQVHADPYIRHVYDERGISSERYMTEGAEILNEITSVDLPAGTILGLHVCKGNGTKSWQAAGGYEEFARDFLQRASGFDLFQLEFDDDRSGSFEPLRYVADDKLCVLGLVSTKEKDLEDAGALRSRIAEAATFHPLEQLALSTQCGFASGAETAEQRLLEWETQERKLRLVAETAHAVWGQ